jgi:hypothetical protein
MSQASRNGLLEFLYFVYSAGTMTETQSSQYIYFKGASESGGVAAGFCDLLR